MMELKPCPCCKGVAALSISSGGDERNGYNFVVNISCECGISLKKPSHHDKNGWCDDTGQAKKECVKAWNLRADQQVVNEALERAAQIAKDAISGLEHGESVSAAIRALKT